jgi:hypothetical protein
MRIVLALAPLFFAVALVGCDTSSSDSPDAEAGAPSDDGGGTLSDGAPIPATSVCTGDATACLSGTLKTSGFTATFPYAEVQLYRVFPSGNAMPIQTQELATDGTFAFSGLAPWGHYYLRGIAQFGPPTAPVFVDTYDGRLAIPTTPGVSLDLVVQPVVVGVAETESGGSRGVTYATAHVFSPATGAELTDAIVSFVASGISTAMPYVTDPTGAKSYYVGFTTPLSATGPFQVQATEAALGASPLSVNVANEASSFEAELTTPADGSTIPVNQAVAVAWPSQPLADYALVELFSQGATSFTGVYSSAGTIATDVTTESIPATAVATAGKYLLNVDLGQASCGLNGSQACAYLVHTAVAKLTAE